ASAIEEDFKGNLWISSNRGIIMYSNDEHKPEFKYFTKDDGLTSSMFAKKSSYKSADGRIFFGNLNGFNWFNPKSIEYDSVPPKLRLKDVTVINKTLQNGTITYHAGQLPGKDIPEIELRHKDYGIRINFTALAYSNPQKNMNAYMLKGYDRSFTYTNSSIRTAQYGSLPPGSYSFVLKAANADGFWCEPETMLTIHVIPPWWKSLWFKLISLFVCIGGIVLFFSIRLWIIKKRNVELERKVELRTQDLNKANQVLQMQAAELVEQKEEIFAQSEEISTQNDELRKQRDQINDKNDELTLHKENLEGLVKKRTIELENAKLKAEESDRLKTYFLANLSHEIRTPMNAINGFAELLSLSKKIPDSNKKHLHIIKHNAVYLMKLIDDILDISMLDANNFKLNIQTINIKEELKSFYNDYNCIYKSPSSDIDFRLALPAENVKIRFDLLRFQQVLNHLLSNAFKYTVSGEVVFGYQMGNSTLIGGSNQVILFVRDTGSGIPEQQLPFIYDAFRQGTSSPDTPDEGLGLGLSIVKGILDLHNYTIKVKTEKNVGTEFSISIPVLS
ncbi:MAG: ATP-binding protein, partial [Bacteroidales bacterium]|nr:ATP-binding protein [Bacteroidales bacterium]